jgi:putative ABC transport system permease protein
VSDLRHSLRSLARERLFSLSAVCTLALALGANTAVFSVVDTVLLRSLHVDHPEKVVVIWPRERANPMTIGEFSYATYRAWQDESPGFTSLAVIGSANWSLILREGEPATIPIAGVSGSFFSTLGASAALGRALVPDDDREGSGRVAVMSHGAWVRRFGKDPLIIGRALRFEDAVYTIVGVMPEGFDYPRGAELWVPVVPHLADASRQWKMNALTDPGFAALFVVGRLEPGVTIDAARARVAAVIARGEGTAFPHGLEPALTPLDAYIFGNTRPALLALAVCAGMVLLIGCANVAVLFLVRATARGHEVATRLALGATTWRIVRQSLADALLLTWIGGSAGVVLAYWTVKILAAAAPSDIPRLDALGFNGRTLVFSSAISLAAAALVGLAPALHASRANLAQMLSSGGSRLVRSRKLRRAFVVVQVGLALTLLVCAGLAGRSFRNLARIDLGFRPAHLLTLDVSLPDAPAERHNPFYTALLTQVRAMPGVEAAGGVFLRPLEHAGIGMDAGIVLEGQRTEPKFRDWEQNPLVNLESATPGYFQAMGLSVAQGRGFTDADTARAPRVAVVSDRLARRLWPEQSALGKRLLPPGIGLDSRDKPEWVTVVGVARDARYRGLTDLRFDLYLPYLQIPSMLVKHLMVKTAGDPFSLVPSIRAEARRLDSAALVENVSTMEALVEKAAAPWRFSAWTLGLLGFLALALATLGVYAAVSQSVVERTREIGVRVAIGARPVQIVGLVVREGVGLTLAGIAIGLAAGSGAGRLLASLLYEVRPIDPLTLAATAALLAAVSVLALALPAWRGARVDPVSALRRE